MWLLFLIVGLLTFVTPVAAQIAQTPADAAGTYNVEWAQVSDYRLPAPEFATGTTVFDVAQSSNGEWTLGGLCYISPDDTPGTIRCSEDRLTGSVLWYRLPDGTGEGEQTAAFMVEATDGASTWFVMRGVRQPATRAPTVTITAPSPGQVLAGTTPIRITTSGFAAGSRSYVLSVDDVQRQIGTVSTDAFTLWFNTTRVANGTHTFTVRVTQGGQTAQASVQVTVGN
jgi:hypothetical protein